MTHPLDNLFHPRRIAIVGASLNDPLRMGTRTLYDLVNSGWQGEIWPVSSRQGELYGLPVWPSLRDLPSAPDVVLARTPQAGMDALVDDAVEIGARFLVVLAAGFAETGEQGLAAQRHLLERAHRGGLRIVGPQSIGLVHASLGLPMSLSQIMERFEMRPGPVALLAQSGAMAISLTIRGQHLGLDFSLVATFGNAADVTPAEAIDWLAGDVNTRVVGIYLEGLADIDAFVQAVRHCQTAGKAVIVLRSGLSRRGAAAVASHTASMSGDGEAFIALCRQLGVVLCESSESFLWAIKALVAPGPQDLPRVAFASISGGACALWADHCDRLAIDLPALDAPQTAVLAQCLPTFLSPANPLDLGPTVFDADAFGAALTGLMLNPTTNLLVVYMFTSSPSLMGGVPKLRQMEALARKAGRPIWVIWEAATDEEWTLLSRSDVLTGFRDLGQAAHALHARGRARPGLGYRAACTATEPMRVDLGSEVAVKAWLRTHGLQVPRGALCADAQAVRDLMLRLGDTGVAVKIVSPQLPHKSDVGGVELCGSDPTEVVATRQRVLDAVRSHRPDVEPLGVLVEERIGQAGLELIVTVRRDQTLGLVTVIGRGGVQVEVDRDLVIHVGVLLEDEVLRLVQGLRCAPLMTGYRGRQALALSTLARTVVRLQQAVLGTAVSEVELNPVLLTQHDAWILDALATAS